MSTQPDVHPIALITGASAGLGAAFAERFARDQYHLVLVARRRQRLEDLARRLHIEHGVTVEVMTADLASPADLAAVAARIGELPHLARLVNNAGFGAYMPFVELEPERAEELIRVQVVAVARLARAALPGMLARREGAIINVSSRLVYSAPLGSTTLPKRATYVGTKAFINTFSQLLAGELEGTGVRVQALCPGIVATEFHEVVGLAPGAYPASMVMSPEDVVQASLAGLALGEVVCVPTLEDSALLAQVDEAQRKLFAEGRSGKLAERYRTGNS
jgi:short-subunit dehydrogenase